MNLEIRGVHYHISDATNEFIEKKLERIDFAGEYIVDLAVTVTKESHGYRADAKVHFRWGVHLKVEEESHELYEAIELMIDKLEQVVRKEKKKKVDKKAPHKGDAYIREELAEQLELDDIDAFDEDEDEDEEL